MEKALKNILPIMDVEHDCILSKQGDITVVFKAELPEIFTLADQEYEAFHQIWVKAIKILPKFSIFHKQDWFIQSSHLPNFTGDDTSFLTRSSERFFNERPFLDHSCYILLTKKPENRKTSSSVFSNLIRSSFIPEQSMKDSLLQDFIDSTGQFKRILEDSGFVQLTRLGNDELRSQSRKLGFIERYCTLGGTRDPFTISDITFDKGVQIGDKQCQIYTLGDAADLPGLCGSRINYDRYSTDKTKFSIGFASSLGQLLPCNHIYNQFIFIEDAQKTIQKLESKRLRLQSLSAYSRENLIARDATNEFLNESISQQRQPVKAHFNVMVWTSEQNEMKDLKNKVSSALVQMDAVAKQETAGAAQIFWAGISGNEADFPMNDTFDTFTEQAACFLNMETGYRSSLSPMGIRLGDRLTGKPVHVDISDEPVRMGICTNRNKFILGPSGSGKSFFTNHMVRSYYEQGTHIVLVDVGHSYKGLCDMVGGYYFTYDERIQSSLTRFTSARRTIWTLRKKKVSRRCYWPFGKRIMKPSTAVSTSPFLMRFNCTMRNSIEIPNYFLVSIVFMNF